MAKYVSLSISKDRGTEPQFEQARKKGPGITNRNIDDEAVELRALGDADGSAPPSNKTALSSSLTASLPISTKLMSECLLEEAPTTSVRNTGYNFLFFLTS